MHKLLILANSGRVRFLVFKESGDDPLDKAHLLEGPGSPVEMHAASIHDTVTDHAGRFSQGGPLGRGAGMSYRDKHELEGQLEIEALKRVAAKIDEIVSVAGYPGHEPERARRSDQAPAGGSGKALHPGCMNRGRRRSGRCNGGA